MRTGILTFHHAYNYGAFLQARGLYGRLESLGHAPEIIDYRNPALEELHERCIEWARFPWRKSANLRRRQRFVEALECLRLSPRATEAVAIDWSRYAAVVFGSDEIWNFATHPHRFDPVYFGGGCPESVRKVAYGPSLGELDARTQAPAPLPGLLGSFDSIAVRDGNAQEFVSIWAGIDAEVVVDPVFLHEFSPEITAPGLRPGELLVYGNISDPAMVAACRKWLKLRRWRAVSVGYRNRWCDRNLMDAGPREFLAMLRNAPLVLTSTFHGTMFAIKYRIPFVTYRGNHALRKFLPLLDTLDLRQRMITAPPEDWAFFESPLPESTAGLLEARIRTSSKFLADALTV